jgi:SAM-dependent methyltransferase
MNIYNIANVVRNAGLMHLSDTFKYYFVKVKNFNKNRQFRQKYPEVVLPPDYILFESFKLDYEKYYIGGSKSANWLITVLEQYVQFKGARILDWGCGPGRMIQHLPNLLGEHTQYFATDYNEKTIIWCQQHFKNKNIRFEHNGLLPPLVFEDHFFQIIYGISIFTHLSLQNHIDWFTELSRVLQKKGVILLTTHGNIFRQRMTPQEMAQFDRGELVVRANVIEGHRVFTTFHPPIFMRNLFETTCEILLHEPGLAESWGLNQDVWVLRKK